jgi:cephalosporin-C deacetylase-like acetyl esterase
VRALLLALLLAGCPSDTSEFGQADDDDSASADDDDAANDDDAVDDDDSSNDDDAGDDDDSSDDDDSADLCADVDCEDSDACTTDTCDPATGDCSNLTFDGDPADAFDVDRLRDPATLNLQILSTNTVFQTVDFLPVSVQVQEVRFDSYDFEGCEEQVVTLEAYVAMPTALVGDLAAHPGLVVAHGLGGFATPNAAATPAAILNVIAVAYSGPGQGSSTGTGSNPDHVFDTAVDPRNSWFWGHAAAALRAATLLETLSEVDTTRLGMTGYSAGAVATLMAGGLDDRFIATAPVSGTGHLQLAIDATPQPGWQADLLGGMTPPRDKTSDEWVNYDRWLDPKNFLATTAPDVLLVNGAQDEFFPITSTVATMADLNTTGGEHRLLTIVDWDHGWFALFNGDTAAIDASNAVNGWLAGRLGTDDDLAPVPSQPTVTLLDEALCPLPCTRIEASIPAVPGYAISSVRFLFGLDGLVYAPWNLQDEGNDTWGAYVGTLDPSLRTDVVSFVEVEYGVDFLGLAVAPFFKNTSIATFPPGFSPTILPSEGPIPP